MADTVEVNYIYPPTMLDGQWEDFSGNKRVIVQLLGLSDGTGETDVTKVDLTDLKTQAGNNPTRTVVEWIQYAATGLTCALEWDRAANALIARMDGNGGTISDKMYLDKLDPGLDDRTGDILLTTTNADSGDTYDITMSIRLKD